MPALLCRFWSWLLPPQRNRLVPWSGPEIFVVVILTQFFWPNLVLTLLQQTGFFERLYGPDFALNGAQAAAPEQSVEEFRISMWVTVLTLPLNVVTIPGVCALLSGARPYQLGLTTHRFGRNLLLGVFGALLVAPLHVLNYYLGIGYQHFIEAPTPHPLARVAEHPLVVDRMIIVISAVLAAPLVEELLFRGCLQPWFCRRRWGGFLALILALALAFLRQRQQLKAAWTDNDWLKLAIALQPAAFVFVCAPGLMVTRRMKRPDVASGIYGTAVLFAAVHSFAWPSPVSLLPLGLVLGWLAYRTGSLVAPMTVHSLFNLIACIQMLKRTE